MPRALLFFNAHRGQCQKRRRLKEAEGDYEKVVGRSPVQRSLCRELVEVVRKRRGKRGNRSGRVRSQVEAVVDR